MSILVIVLTVSMIFFLFITITFAQENENLKKKLKEERKWRRQPNDNSEKYCLMQDNYRLRSENTRLVNKIKDLERKLEQMLPCRNKPPQPTNDSDVIEAVRKVMIYSHPDKGNCSNADDFIKYKKLYDKLKGDNKNGKQHY